MITYEKSTSLSTDAFIEILERSGLAERRPIDDRECLEGMLKHANLTIIAKDGTKIVGVARSVTDFSYCCYLSDLAVDREYQKQGIGTAMMKKAREYLGPKCNFILLSAPAATEYYPKVGFSKHESAWWVKGDEQLKYGR